MNLEPRVIILCWAYNCESYVAKTVESVLNQTYKNYKFVIYENGSTDGTRQILRKYKDHPNVVYQEIEYNLINYPGKSEYKSVYDIFPVNDKDYFTALDSDDYLEPDALESMVKVAVEHDADVVFAGCNMFLDGNDTIVNIRKPGKKAFYEPISQIAADWISVYGSVRVRWGNLYRYNLFKESSELVNSFKLVNGSDTLQNILLLGITNNVATLNKAVINYRIRNNSIYHSRINPERYKAYDVILEETYKLFEKWGVENPDLIQFTELVRMSAIEDLVGNAAKSKADFNDNVQLLNNIFLNDKFIGGIRKNGLEYGFVKTAIDVLQKEACLEEYEVTQLASCPALLIAEALRNSEINLGLYLAGLHHNNNPYKVGITEAYRVYDALDADIRDKFAKDEFVDILLDINKLHELLVVYGRDREGAKNLLITAADGGNAIGLIEGIFIAENFYNQDVEMMYLAAWAYGLLRLYAEGINLLGRSLDFVETNEQVQVIGELLNEFKKAMESL